MLPLRPKLSAKPSSERCAVLLSSLLPALTATPVHVTRSFPSGPSKFDHCWQAACGASVLHHAPSINQFLNSKTARRPPRCRALLMPDA